MLSVQIKRQRAGNILQYFNEPYQLHLLGIIGDVCIVASQCNATWRLALRVRNSTDDTIC